MNMLKRLVLAILILALGSSVTQAQEWKVDQAHSWVGFEVRHMVISTVKGQFTDFDGKLRFDGKQLEDGSVEFAVQTSSVDTKNEKRDAHLKSDEFLNAEKFPTITFKSKKIILGEGDQFQLVGDLTIRDVTKEVTFDCVYHGAIDTPWGFRKAGFSAKTTIDRQDYGVSWSKTLDTGGLVASDDVDLILELEFNEVKA
jgi:polyisoprenoid-binding protein YceI